MKIIIHSPPYQMGSGGIRVLHHLGHLCSVLGHQVDMKTETFNPDYLPYHTPVDIPDLTIVPEIHEATSLPKYRNVVRWVLYFPGYLAGPTSYPDHELIAPFHPEYVEEYKTRHPHQYYYDLFLPVSTMPGLDSPVERDLPGCYWAGKGEPKPMPEQNLIAITRTWPAPRSELVKLLKRCKKYYTFDAFTALNQEAELCGCEVLIYKDGEYVPFVPPIEARTVIPSEVEQLEQVKQFLDAAAKYFGVRT